MHFRVCRSGWGCTGDLLINSGSYFPLVKISSGAGKTFYFCTDVKKLLSAILLLTYFAASTGMVVNAHYCMGRLASVHFFETAAEQCGICGMETHESNGCCHDEVMAVKLVQDQQNTQAINPAFKTPVEQPVVETVYLLASIQNGNSRNHFQHHSPPLLSAQDSYIANRVFRI